jgi:osmotically-inducible protein OsmY
MRSDSDIKRDVEMELKWDPDISEADIAVAVKDGVVTLTGFVRSYAQKWQAERDAKRVAGVVAVANDIEVRLPAIDQRPYSADRIKVVVNNGWVTLEGELEWNYQKERAEEAVRHIKGVKGVMNMIMLKPKLSPTEIKRKIEEAFKRSAEIDANRIVVETNGSEVILKGSVRSWAEREEAEREAWRAPGVTKVIDQIEIRP